MLSLRTHLILILDEIGAMFEVFTTVKIQVEVFWVVSPCSVVIGYQRFGDPWYLHLQGEGRRQHGPLKRWYPTTIFTRRHNPEDIGLKNLEACGRALFEGIIPPPTWKVKKPCEAWVRITSTPVDIRTGYLSGISLECYSCTTLLGIVSIEFSALPWSTFMIISVRPSVHRISGWFL